MAASAKALQEIAASLASLDTKVDGLENVKEVRAANEKREAEALLVEKDRDNKLYMILLALVGAIVGAEAIGTPFILEIAIMAHIATVVLITGRLAFVKPGGWWLLVIGLDALLIVGLLQLAGLVDPWAIFPLIVSAVAFILYSLTLKKEPGTIPEVA